MKKFIWLFTVGVFLLTACHSDDDEKKVENLTPGMLAPPVAAASCINVWAARMTPVLVAALMVMASLVT